VDLWLDQHHQGKWSAASLGEFILLGGEVATMTMMEAVVRLVPRVIKESGSWQHESYDPLQGMSNIEHPHYTRPQEVRGMNVPEILLSGDEKKVREWQKGQSQ
jgi:tRNA (guanine37-N1)-methyltransferase